MKKKGKKNKRKRILFIILICFLAAVFVIGLISFGINGYTKHQHKKYLFDKYDFLKDLVLEEKYGVALEVLIELNVALRNEKDPDLMELYRDVQRLESIIMEKLDPIINPNVENIEGKNIVLKERLLGEIYASEPNLLAFSPDGSELYAAKERYDNTKIYVIDADLALIERAFLAARLSWMKVSADGKLLLGAVHCDEQPGYGLPRAVAYSLPCGWEVLDKVTGVGDPSFLMGGTISSNGEYIFAGTKGTNELIKVDVSNGKKFVYSLNFPPFNSHCRQPYCNSVSWAGADITKDNSRVYFLVRTQTDSMDYVVEIDAKKWRFKGYWGVGKSTADAGLVLSPDEKSVYVIQNNEGMKKLDLETGRIRAIHDVRGWMAARVGQTPYLVTNRGQIVDTISDEVVYEITSAAASGYVATSLDGKIAFSNQAENKIYLMTLEVEK